MLTVILEKIIRINELFFSYPDKLISTLALPDWVSDAITDSVHLLPFLFLAFLIIEFLEYYHADKINHLLNKNGRKGVIIGSFAAMFPQCGFSVMAAGLYSKRIITKGCLIAVFLVTSDETVPILLAMPEKMYLIIPILLTKLFIGIAAGILTDILIPFEFHNELAVTEIKTEEGCCKHDIEAGNKRELIIHPLIHTLNVFGFILLITLILNFWLDINPVENISGHEYIQPIIASLVGLVPNCAISIGLTMMLIKGTITFGTAMSGLLSNAGLGLLVLMKNNDFKDTLKIIFILLFISIVSGIVINLLT